MATRKSPTCFVKVGREPPIKERNKQKLVRLIAEDRRVTITEIAVQLGNGHRAVQEMV
jgi:hypothetical protein